MFYIFQATLDYIFQATLHGLYPPVSISASRSTHLTHSSPPVSITSRSTHLLTHSSPPVSISATQFTDSEYTDSQVYKICL